MAGDIERDVEPYLNPTPQHRALFEASDEELLAYGGASSGKSFTIADKLLLAGPAQPKAKLKTVVIRRTLPSLKATSLDILQKRAELFGLPFGLNKNELTAECGNMHFLFRSANNKEDIEKLKSLTDVDFVWINELPELRDEDYEEILRRLRGGESWYNQLIADFNPIGKTSWVYERFFQKNVGNVRKLHFTPEDNHPAYLATPKAKRYIERLKALKDHNPNAYKIYYLGEWGELEGVIFDWDVVPLPDMAWDSVGYGGDFGYTVDPAALVKVYRKADEYWFEEMIYETGLDNQQLGKRCLRMGLTGNDTTIWDCAEPKSIAELCVLGLTALPCLKGPDSVKAGIDCLKQHKCHIVEGSEHIIREARSYVWKVDKNGKPLAVPVEFDDHAMSAIRYYVHTSRIQGGAMLYTSKMLEEALSKDQELVDLATSRLMYGQTVGCTEQEFRGFLKQAIQEQADQWEESGDDKRAKHARAEVSRLERVFWSDAP